MNKKLLLLPSLALLTACGGIGNNSKNIKVEDRSNNPDVIVRDVSNFDWSDNTQQPAKNTDEFSADSPQAAAIATLKADGVKFILYFSYDGFDIDEATTQEIIKHANFMRDNPEINLRLEGHADERGTREYNLALGENRAISVKEVLSLYEGLHSRVQIVSFGEENPVSQEHNEAGWEQDRRVKFVYKANNK